MRCWNVLLSFVLLLLATIGFAVMGCPESGPIETDHIPFTARIWTVALDGTGDFDSIQGAIDAASEGDAIRVYKGTYMENVVIGKRLVVIGNGTDQTIVDGNRADHRDTISITADHVNLSGFQAKRAYIGHEFAGIGIRSSHGRIVNNRCLDNDYGILIIGGSDNLVQGNDASNNNRNGLHMRFTSGNRIDGNAFSYSTTTQGIYLEGGQGNAISNNTCCMNYKYGISLYASQNNVLTNNSCCGSSLFTGISLYNANGNNVSFNNCSDNGLSGISIYYSSENTILRNTVRSNIDGIKAVSMTGCEVHLNMIEGNRGYGVNVTDHTGPNLDCTLNWWGNESGPYHPDLNADGSGDNVSDNVDFIPWLNMSQTNGPPRITTVDITTVLEDQAYSVIYRGTDPDLDAIEWSFWTDSPWLTWDRDALSLSGTPTNAHVGKWNVRIGITDGNGGSDEHLFELEVQNIPPVITTFDATEAFQNDLFIMDYNSSDDLQGNVTWHLTTDHRWLSLDRFNGYLSGTPSNDDVGTSFVRISVMDGNGGMDNQEFPLKVVDRNDPPSIGPVPEELVWEEDGWVFVDLDDWFFDIDGDVLTYVTCTSGNITLTDEGNGSIELRSLDDWSGTGSLLVKCRDLDLQVEAEVNITVAPMNDAPVDATITIQEGGLFDDRPVNATGNAVDPDLEYGDVLTYDWYSNSSGFLGSGRTVELKLPAGQHRLSLNVTDSSGASTVAMKDIWIGYGATNGSDPDDGGNGTNGTTDDDGPEPVDDDASTDDDGASGDDDEVLPPSSDPHGRPSLRTILLVLFGFAVLLLTLLILILAASRRRRDRRADEWEE